MRGLESRSLGFRRNTQKFRKSPLLAKHFPTRETKRILVIHLVIKLYGVFGVFFFLFFAFFSLIRIL